MALQEILKDKKNIQVRHRYAFLNLACAEDEQMLTLNLMPEHFLFFAASGAINIKTIELLIDNSGDPGLFPLKNINVISHANIALEGSPKPGSYGGFLAGCH